jgi:flagellin-like hook-associated protein FlgL
MQSSLLTLKDTTSLINRTLERTSTGKKVNSALDDAVNFFLAQSLTQNASDFATAKDNMAISVRTLKAADAGITAINSLLSNLKSIAQNAKSATTTLAVTTFAAAYDVVRNQIDSIAVSSGTNNADGTFNSKNLLAAEVMTVQLGSSSSLTVTGFDASTGATGLNVIAATGAWTAPGVGAIDTALTDIDNAMQSLKNNAQLMSSNMSIVTIRQKFADNMIKQFTGGAEDLTNADMNEESANLLMLQTRQALALQGISIAGQAAQASLRLNGG